MRTTAGICCGLLTAISGLAQAGDALDDPLALSNRSPLIQIYGLPAARSGEVLASEQTRFRLGYDVASNFALSQSNGQSGGESVFLDGETQRLELGARGGLGHNWEVGITVPLIKHSGGGLDSFIEGWHKFWNLPRGDRPDYPRNQLDYRYTRNGQTLLNLDDATAGIGDVQLDAAYSLMRGDDSAVALQATFNLPTGDADKLTGSGATNVGLTLAATQYNLFGWQLAGTGNIGVLWLDRGDVLPRQQKDSVWFGSLGLSWAPGQNWRLKAQVDAHTAFYRSALKELGDDSAQLLLGGSVKLSPRWLLDVSVAEDIAVDTAPDVVFQLALRTAY